MVVSWAPGLCGLSLVGKLAWMCGSEEEMGLAEWGAPAPGGPRCTRAQSPQACVDFFPQVQKPTLSGRWGKGPTHPSCMASVLQDPGLKLSQVPAKDLWVSTYNIDGAENQHPTHSPNIRLNSSLRLARRPSTHQTHQMWQPLQAKKEQHGA